MVDDTQNNTKRWEASQAETRPMTPEEGRKAIEIMEQMNRENAMKREDGSASASAALRAPEAWLAFPQIDGLGVAAIEVLYGAEALSAHQQKVKNSVAYRYVPYFLAENAGHMHSVLSTIHRTLPHIEQSRTIYTIRKDVATALAASEGK